MFLGLSGPALSPPAAPDSHKPCTLGDSELNDWVKPMSQAHTPFSSRARQSNQNQVAWPTLDCPESRAKPRGSAVESRPFQCRGMAAMDSDTRKNKRPKTLRAWEKESDSRSSSDWVSGDNEQAAVWVTVDGVQPYNSLRPVTRHEPPLMNAVHESVGKRGKGVVVALPPGLSIVSAQSTV